MVRWWQTMQAGTTRKPAATGLHLQKIHLRSLPGAHGLPLLFGKQDGSWFTALEGSNNALFFLFILCIHKLLRLFLMKFLYSLCFIHIHKPFL